MDENKLADLLKDAVAETPPPTFTASDVSRESDRQRVRHRNGVLAGSAFGVALLAGATALGVALWTGPGVATDAMDAESAASGGNGNAAPYELPNEDNNAAAPTERGGAEDFPSETPKQGGYPDGSGGPAGPAGTPRGCEQVDRELAAALAGELPAAANVDFADAIPVSVTCPQDAIGAAYDLPGGRVSVIVIPDDVMLTTQTSGGTRAEAPTDDGRRVFVVSEPVSPGGTAPFGSDIQRIATELGQLY
ncbi:hypothetical protein [Actinophytocola algeriensis]|uniref:Uncharacterized protein n=1 Tax=Actinophytocola algeriensis TaxID=1768010 RepID=A0A7W7Q3U6_9PSEU|nr:hypothetical protein [Actinophytocola algeriensis]MBB4906520.1 hypothetical protein [Actinophytocola algeriensis]MBE1478001.1 hypothetical protein [Actinophytocola algeriensis]